MKTSILFIFLLLFYSEHLQCSQNKIKTHDSAIEFKGKISVAVYFNAVGDTALKNVRLFANSKPFTISDGYCFLSGISHDMDQAELKHKRVYRNHRSPFRYQVGANRETGQWRVTIQGGGSGSYVGVRCVKF